MRRKHSAVALDERQTQLLNGFYNFNGGGHRNFGEAEASTLVLAMNSDGSQLYMIYVDGYYYESWSGDSYSDFYSWYTERSKRGLISTWHTDKVLVLPHFGLVDTLFKESDGYKSQTWEVIRALINRGMKHGLESHGERLHRYERLGIVSSPMYFRDIEYKDGSFYHDDVDFTFAIGMTSSQMVLPLVMDKLSGFINGDGDEGRDYTLDAKSVALKGKSYYKALRTSFTPRWHVSLNNVNMVAWDDLHVSKGMDREHNMLSALYHYYAMTHASSVQYELFRADSPEAMVERHVDGNTNRLMEEKRYRTMRLQYQQPIVDGSMDGSALMEIDVKLKRKTWDSTYLPQDVRPRDHDWPALYCDQPRKTEPCKRFGAPFWVLNQRELALNAWLQRLVVARAGNERIVVRMDMHTFGMPSIPIYSNYTDEDLGFERKDDWMVTGENRLKSLTISQKKMLVVEYLKRMYPIYEYYDQAYNEMRMLAFADVMRSIILPNSQEGYGLPVLSRPMEFDLDIPTGVMTISMEKWQNRIPFDTYVRATERSNGADTTNLITLKKSLEELHEMEVEKQRRLEDEIRDARSR